MLLQGHREGNKGITKSVREQNGEYKELLERNGYDTEAR